MYRPHSLVRSLLLLALAALAFPLSAQEQPMPPAAPADQNPPPEPAPQAPQAVAPYGVTPQNQVQQNLPHQNQDNPFQGTPLGGGNVVKRRDPREVRREQGEMRLRVMMSDFGIDDANQQDALIAYLAEDEAGKATVRDAGRRLLTALRRGTDPQRTRDLVRVYKGALDADKERRRASQTALDAKIGFSLNPRLEAALWLFGVLGEGQAGLPLNSLMGRNTMNPQRNGGPPFGAIPNFPNRGEFARREINGPTGGQGRAGTVTGTIVSKGEGWLDLRDTKGNLERYMPFWTAAKTEEANRDGDDPVAENANANAAGDAAGNIQGGAYDRAVLEAIRQCKIGDTVRLEWVWSERKRVVKLEPWTPPRAEATTIAPPAPAPNEPIRNGTIPNPAPEQG